MKFIKMTFDQIGQLYGSGEFEHEGETYIALRDLLTPGLMEVHNVKTGESAVARERGYWTLNETVRQEVEGAA